MGDKKKVTVTLGAPPDPIAVLRAHRSSVNAVAFYSPNLLLSGDAEGEFRVWDVPSRRTLSSTRAHSLRAGVIGIGSSQLLENTILSQGRDGSIKCWQLLEGGCLSKDPSMTISTNSYHFCKLSVLSVSTAPAVAEVGQDYQNQTMTHELNLNIPTGKSLVAIAGEDPSVAEIWDLNTGRRVEKLQTERTKTAGMCMALQLFVPPGISGIPNVLAGYEDGSMLLWDLRSSKSPLVSTRFHNESVISIALDPSCQGGISGAADDITVFFNIDYKENALVLKKKHPHGRHGIGGVSIRSDAKIAATGGWDHRVRVYDYARGRPLAILKYHSSSVTGVVFSQDNSSLASSSGDSSIALWSIYPP